MSHSSGPAKEPAITNDKLFDLLPLYRLTRCKQPLQNLPVKKGERKC